MNTASDNQTRHQTCLIATTYMTHLNVKSFTDITVSLFPRKIMIYIYINVRNESYFSTQQINRSDLSHP